MKAAASALTLKALRISPEARSVNGIVMKIRQYNQPVEGSSSSNWGTGEPPIDETHTERGVSRDQASTGTTATTAVGRQDDQPTSTSNFDTGEHTAGQDQSKQPKKSRTGVDMSDEGQVHTPNLGKMRSTRDMIHNRGKEMESERAASQKDNP